MQEYERLVNEIPRSELNVEYFLTYAQRADFAAMRAGFLQDEQIARSLLLSKNKDIVQLANSSLVASVVGGDQAKSQRFGQLLDYFGDYGLTAEDFRNPERFKLKFLERQWEFLAGVK